MGKLALRGLLLVGAIGLLGVGSFATAGRGGTTFTAELSGYDEVVGGPGAGSTGSVSTLARGTFRARLADDPQRLEFTLSYDGIEGGAVTQAHPHLAQRHVGGNIFTFLCGGPKPACPATEGTVTGTILASDIGGPAEQGVEPGAFDEFVRALRAGAVYVNVHSPLFPEGEIRGQIDHGPGNFGGRRLGDDG